MDSVFNWITQYGYAAIFMLLMLGIVGLPVPDESLLMFVGYLSSKGNLHLGASLLAAFFGSACGISISYGLGKFFGRHVTSKVGHLFHLRPEQVMHAETWVQRWGKYSLPISYFVPGIRHVAALIVGGSQLRLGQFALFAYTGALLWSGTFIGLGYGFGKEWTQVSPSVRTVIGVLLFVATAITIAFVLLRSTSRRTP